MNLVIVKHNGGTMLSPIIAAAWSFVVFGTVAVVAGRWVSGARIEARAN